MARTVKPEAFAAKRKEILHATHRLVLTKGYEQMSIQDILDEVQISSGAFHHYFDSRSTLLDALVEDIKHETEQPLLPIIHDPHLSAIEKFQGFFDTLDRLRIIHKADVVKLARVWYTDANALVRQKVDEAILQQRTPLLTKIVHQGIQEKLFSLASPDKAGEVILSLLQGMGNAHARLLFPSDPEHDDQSLTEEIIMVHSAYMEAIERVLGIPPHTFARTSADAVNIWLTALRNNDHGWVRQPGHNVPAP